MDLTKLTGIVPDHVLSVLTPDFLTRTSINGPLRLSNFLGQASEESANFSVLSENLNYGLPQLYSADPQHPALWQKHFASVADAAPYVHHPAMIANRIYANRLGNGDEASGDGWKYRGRGYIQLTGKSNYKAFQDWVNAHYPPPVDLLGNPDLLKTPPYDLLCAGWFFTANNIWTICDKGVDKASVHEVTQKVNGGQMGFDIRFGYTQKIYFALIH